MLINWVAHMASSFISSFSAQGGGEGGSNPNKLHSSSIFSLKRSVKYAEIPNWEVTYSSFFSDSMPKSAPLGMMTNNGERKSHD